VNNKRSQPSPNDAPQSHQDPYVAAADFCRHFKLGLEHEMNIGDMLATADRRRLVIPFVDGEPLVLMRPCGAEARELIARPGLTYEYFDRMPHVIAGGPMIDLIDRVGVDDALAVYLLGHDETDMAARVAECPLRTEPVRQKEILPFLVVEMRREIVRITGMDQGIDRDFKRHEGRWIPKPGCPADMIKRMLNLVGWRVSNKDIRKAYKLAELLEG
jgi:hypothetical protein